MRVFTAVALSAVVLLCTLHVCAAFRIGVASEDVTGPVAEVGFMGYAKPDQKGSGLHTRQFARAFVFADDNGNNPVAFVSADICMTFHNLKVGVLSMLGQKFPNVYNDANLMITGTHTHAGPGGFSYHPLYDITTLGFQKENHDAIVSGLFNAVAQAHLNMVNSSPGSTISLYNGTLLNTNINRSPTSHVANPDAPLYPYDVDKMITALRLQDSKSNDIGLISWFAVHGTSMNNNNTLVSGDNKGYASELFEELMRPSSPPGYVSAFAQTNSGDVSPRTKGAFCPDGTPCVDSSSTCNGKNEGCNGVGPGATDYESAQIIGAQQFEAVFQMIFGAESEDDTRATRTFADIRSKYSHLPVNTTLLNVSTPVTISGKTAGIHRYVNMESTVVTPAFSGTGYNQTTCTGAMGDSFAAGTTDGPGAMNFIQGTNVSTTNPFWNFLGHFLSKPTTQQIQCQAPKPILLNTGAVTFPCPWTVSVQPLQIIQIGQLFLIGTPGEFTTQSGRRLRDTVTAALIAAGVPNPLVIIAAIANSYGGYITTHEEFRLQRYEAASTIYGPYTLNAYQQEFSALATLLGSNTPNTNPGPTPADYSSKTFNFLTGVVLDTTPIGKSFGSVSSDVGASSFSVSQPNLIIKAVFWGANPRNNFGAVPTFLTVDRFVNGAWSVWRTDAVWETKFRWKRVGVSQSQVTVEWWVPQNTPLGQYRLHVYGQSKNLLGHISPYDGVSSSFNLVP